MNFRKIAENYRDYLLRQLSDINSELNNAPEGYIQIYRNKNWWKWKQVYPAADGKGPLRTTTIPKKQPELAEKLCAKHELQQKKNLLTRQLDAINHLIDCYPASVRKSSIEDIPEFKRLLSEYHKKNQIISEEWTFEPYEKNTDHPEGLIVPTSTGALVRSKSEAIIANELYENHIPFHYEQKISFPGMSVCPDFTIINPATQQMVLWEHFGLIDSESYRNSAKSKLGLYLDTNYIPGYNLIVTYETKEVPLNSRYVYALIQYHFC